MCCLQEGLLSKGAADSDAPILKGRLQTAVVSQKLAERSAPWKRGKIKSIVSEATHPLCRVTAAALSGAGSRQAETTEGPTQEDEGVPQSISLTGTRLYWNDKADDHLAGCK